jgi:hypothetical protein
MVKPRWIPRACQQIKKFFRNLLPGDTNDANHISIIKEYIDDVGPRVAASELSGFVTTCLHILMSPLKGGWFHRLSMSFYGSVTSSHWLIYY